LKYSPLDTYIFENNFFRISESGFWKLTKESEIKASSKIENVYIDSPYFTLIPNELASHIPLEEKKKIYFGSRNGSKLFRRQNIQVSNYDILGN
jgi:hypothetical protein